MDGILFQDYITVSLSSSAAPLAVTQGSDSWLDVSGYEDLVFFLDVKSVSGLGIPIYYQTSPTREDLSFLNMINSVILATGVRADPALASFCKVPAAAWLRWQIPPLEPAFGYTVTFRIVLGAYSLQC